METIISKNVSIFSPIIYPNSNKSILLVNYPMDNTKLWNKLKEYLSYERINAFDCVLSDRTRHFTVVVENLF